MSAGAGRSLRYLGDPRPVAVERDAAGRINAVGVAGRRRSVEAERDDWIVQDRWWTDAPIERRYHELVLDGGRVMTIYRDLMTGSWFGYGVVAAGRRERRSSHRAASPPPRASPPER